MNKRKKQQSKDSYQKAGAKSHDKMAVTYSGEEAQEQFLALMSRLESQVVSDYIYSILERIVIKKGLDSDDIWREIVDSVRRNDSNFEAEKSIEMMAEKIIRGKTVVEL